MSNRLTLLALRGYHHPSVHDNPLQTVRSWMESTPTLEGWNSAQVKFKIHLTLTCRVRPIGTNSSSNSHGHQCAAETTTRSVGGLLTVHGIQPQILGHELAWGRTPAEVPCILGSAFYFLHLFTY
jgi:hypothetical protein